MKKLYIIIFLIILLISIILIVYFNFPDNKITTFVKQKKPLQKKYLNKIYDFFLPDFFENNITNTLNHVDKIYCITMPQRRKYITNELKKLNTNIRFFDAITPEKLSSIDYNTLSTTFIEESIIFNKLTKLPVQLSFTMCFIDALKNGYENIIIFEDDISVETSRLFLEESLKEFKNSYFSMFYMGYCLMDCNQKFNTDKYKYIVEVPNKSLFCNHSVAFKTKYLEKLLDYLYPMITPNDNSIINFLIDNKQTVCVPKKILFEQDRLQLGSYNENPEPLPPTCNL